MNSSKQGAPSKDLVAEFVGNRAHAYYSAAFRAIGDSSAFVWMWNWGAFLLGPVWFCMRSIWSMMLVFLIIESFAVTQIGRALWGNLTGEIMSRIATINTQLGVRHSQLDAAISAGKDSVDALKRNIAGLETIAAQLNAEIQSVEAGRIRLLLLGIVLLVLARCIQAVVANPMLARKFSAWLPVRSNEMRQATWKTWATVAFVLAVYAVNLAYYAFAVDLGVIYEFPAAPAFRAWVIAGIEGGFNYVTTYGGWMFGFVSFGIRIVLDFLETLFVQTPWLVVASFVVVLTGLSAGGLAAAMAAAFLAFIGVVGLWTLAMQTLALLGTAACISIAIGIPLGIYCAHRPRVYNFVRPILDMQQTIPTFVYMIPIIALFGTGKPAAVITCLIFGMPPVVRLTVLGIHGVPHSIREAAIAYGASEWFMMTRIELPLAAPSIRTGINQTILLSLLTVVVASLIGAKGLGESVLEALQYASIGQGLLAGIAILFIAKILDRIFMGSRHGA